MVTARTCVAGSRALVTQTVFDGARARTLDNAQSLVGVHADSAAVDCHVVAMATLLAHTPASMSTCTCISITAGDDGDVCAAAPAETESRRHGPTDVHGVDCTLTMQWQTRSHRPLPHALVCPRMQATAHTQNKAEGLGDLGSVRSPRYALHACVH